MYSMNSFSSWLSDKAVEKGRIGAETDDLKLVKIRVFGLLSGRDVSERTMLVIVFILGSSRRSKSRNR